MSNIILESKLEMYKWSDGPKIPIYGISHKYICSTYHQ